MKTRYLVVVTVLFMLGVILSACSVSTATASCAFIVGNGQSGNDAKVHNIIYPGQTVPTGTDENVTYVPCNSRNYIINDGKRKNANGKTIGDRDILITAYTSTGVPINIAAHALWTLNQSRPAMEAFYATCLKYKCASEEDISGDANFSSEGWNGMLGENFSGAMDTAALKAANTIDDSIWSLHTETKYKELGDGMSSVFADVMRANLGYTVDLFCGSGNSTWSDPNQPGVGDFNCTPVRIIVDDVQRGQVSADEGTAGALTISKQRLENAKELYGDRAGYWLALQDTIDKCRGAGTTCVFNIGNVDGSAVAVPVNNPTPTPLPEPTATPGR